MVPQLSSITEAWVDAHAVPEEWRLGLWTRPSELNRVLWSPLLGFESSIPVGVGGRSPAPGTRLRLVRWKGKEAEPKPLVQEFLVEKAGNVAVGKEEAAC